MSTRHQFVAPGVLLNQGIFPYADYPCFHMPTLSYVYAAIFRLTSMPLLAARTFSAACGTAIVVLLFLFGWRRLAPVTSRSTCWIIAGGLPLTFLASRFFTYTSGWAWNHESAALCALGAFLVHMHALRTGRLSGFALAGLLLALATGIRLSYALTFLPFAISLFASRSPLSTGGRIGGLALAVTAALVGFVPALVHPGPRPGRVRVRQRRLPNLQREVLRVAVRPGPRLARQARPRGADHVRRSGQRRAHDPVRRRPRHRRAAGRLSRKLADGALRRTGFLLLATIPDVHLAGIWGPTPSFYQYYFQLAPTMILIVVSAAGAVAARPAGRTVSLARLTFAWAAVTLVSAGIGLPRWYWPVIGAATPREWTPIQVHDLGVWIASRVPPETEVLTADPIYPLEGGRRIYPALAVGRFPVLVGRCMSPEERRRHRIAPPTRKLERMCSPIGPRERSSAIGSTWQVRTA